MDTIPTPAGGASLLTFEQFLAAQKAAKGHGNPLARWFANRKVFTKIVSVIVVMGLVVLGVAAVAVAALDDANAKASVIYDDSLQSVGILADVDANFRQMRTDVLNHAISESDANLTKYEGKIKDDDAAVADALGKYLDISKGDDGATTPANAFGADMDKYRDIVYNAMIPASKKNDFAALETIRDTQVAPVAADMVTQMTAMQAHEMGQADAADKAVDQSRTHSLTLLAIITVVGLVVATGVAVVVARMIVNPLRRVSDVLRAVADGDLTRSASVESTDEVGDMARQVGEAVSSMRMTLDTLSRSSVSLASASDELSGVSGQIAASAQESSAQAGVVAAAAEQVSRNVQTVAAGAEQMSASIAEIAQNAHEAARVGTDAVAAAEATNVTVAQLGESSQEIGDVIKVITMIAEQTSMLALNATIEAARAGEAGKGFAVVANEVKDLAEKTAKATENIGARVAKIQTDAVGAAEAIAQIGSIVDRINEYQITIASAVEQQNNTTNEMNRNVTEAALGSSEIAGNIAGVATAADETTAGVTRAEESARELARMSGDLRELVSRFRF